MLDLMEQVSEGIRLQAYQTIASYLRDIQALENELALHRSAWNGTITVANEVIKAITVIKKCVTKMNAKEASAGKDWMAFWGIYQESVGSHPPYI
jgi:hypothetical protein